MSSLMLASHFIDIASIDTYMSQKLIRDGWVRCPACGSEEVGFVVRNDIPHLWMEHFRCNECRSSISKMM